jgi:hypothetical protein
MKIPADVAKDILFEEIGGEIIEDKIISHSRWSVIHSLIIKYNDKYYKTSYSVGATEYQDEQAWEYDDEVELVEVHQVPKTIMVWEAVK